MNCLYGHQEGAQIGCNPRKISLGFEVHPGKEQAAAPGMPGIWFTLEGQSRDRWPTCVHSGCGYGREKIMREFEARELPYLLKLRHTSKVKALVHDLLRQSGGSQDCAEGWEAAEASIKLSRWTRARRVVIVREASATAPVGEQNAGGVIPLSYAEAKA